MARGNNSTVVCEQLWVGISKSIRLELWRVNTLLVTNAILAGVIVGIGAYAQRYRHRPSTRFIFLGATTLFLPIFSTVVSSNANSGKHIKDFDDEQHSASMVADCYHLDYSILVIIWAFLVQFLMFNTSVVVAVDDREGQNKGPPFELFELLVQGLWTLYLGVSYVSTFFLYIPNLLGLWFPSWFSSDPPVGSFEIKLQPSIVYGIPFAIICAKIAFKFCAFLMARQSFAFGRNPCLVFGYMQQTALQEASQHSEPSAGEVPADDAYPPPLLVMGEETRQVEKRPNGCVFKNDSGTTSHRNIGLVTLDRVWQLDGMLPLSTRQLKDLCLSFASFKLLRCRFVRYEFTNARSKAAFNFFWSMLLKDGEHDRIFGVIVDEISFAHDYYYSSLPVSYSTHWLPIVCIFLSVLSIGYCIVCGLILMLSQLTVPWSQISCEGSCTYDGTLVEGRWEEEEKFGSAWFGLPIVLLLCVLVMIAEVREIASYICSNWTKVTLVCRLVNRASSQHCLCMRKWVVGILLRCRCKLLKHWDETMGQCSVLEVHPGTNPFVFVKHFLHLPDRKGKVKVTTDLKACIIEAMRRSNSNRRQLSNGAASLGRSQAGESFLWTCNGKGTSDTILTWHIATSILEVRHPFQQPPDPKMVAVHLSRYCAYLVSYCPELLPDDNAWSKGLYKDVKKEAERALAGGHAMTGSSSTPEAKYQQLMDKLGPSDAANSMQQHEVLKNGVKLGKQLVELATQDGELTVWKLLANLWSEMILFVAPSDNLKGHSEAIARGGELITLLWVLLFHVGIVSRPAGEDDDGTAAAAANASAGVV